MTPPRSLILAGLTAALLSSAAACADAPARAMTERDPLSDFVRARAADDLGQLDVSAAGYAAALAGNPGSTMLGLRTFRQAMIAGDLALAVRTAKALDAAGSLPPDGVVVLASDAVVTKDWSRATALVDRIEREKLFAFLAPTMRAWVLYGGRKGDPLAALPVADASHLALAYAAEHRPLLLIATGKADEGVAALAALNLDNGGRAVRLRIAAAAGLAARHRKAQALALLTSEDAATVRARAAITAGHKVRGAIDTAGAGIAELLVRVAADVNRDQAGPLAIEFARLATLLAPDDSEAALVTAGLLASAGDTRAALAALDGISGDDPFISETRDMRLTLLGRSGQSAQALADAKAAAATPDATSSDWARLGDLLTEAHDYAGASQAYGNAFRLVGTDKVAMASAWPLLLERANALLQSGDWPSSKATAEQALAFAPQQPAILNFLGYSELEHGENVPAAGAMIAQASALAPDDSSITDSLGWSWYVRGDLAKAIPLLEQAAEGAPTESDINEHLGDAYWRVGRKLDARYAWRAALVAADPDAVDRLKAKIDYGATGKP